MGKSGSLGAAMVTSNHRFLDADRTATQALALFEKRARDPGVRAVVGESLLLLAKAQLGLGQFTTYVETALV